MDSPAPAFRQRALEAVDKVTTVLLATCDISTSDRCLLNTGMSKRAVPNCSVILVPGPINCLRLVSCIMVSVVREFNYGNVSVYNAKIVVG